MNPKDAIGAENYERLRTIFKTAFPSPNTAIPDTFVDSVVNSMWKNYQTNYSLLGVPAPLLKAGGAAPAPAAGPAPAASATYPLYMGNAHHHRVLEKDNTTPIQSEFVGHLPLVRVPLPATISGNEFINTQIGQVYLNADHLVGSLELVAQKYADAAHLGYVPARVDLITPARLYGARFGAIATYLGYKNASDTTPSFYLLEAGMATGGVNMLFYGQTMTTVIRQNVFYTPTPFTAPSNFYQGQITMNGNDPDVLNIQANSPGKPPYITVNLQYQPMPSIPQFWPELLTLEAAERVALVAKTMNIPNAVPIQDILALLAEGLPWIQKPHT